jgi:hypothetical protein
LKNYKRHPVEFTFWRYLDIDPAERERGARMARQQNVTPFIPKSYG